MAAIRTGSLTLRAANGTVPVYVSQTTAAKHSTTQGHTHLQEGIAFSPPVATRDIQRDVLSTAKSALRSSSKHAPLTSMREGRSPPRMPVRRAQTQGGSLHVPISMINDDTEGARLFFSPRTVSKLSPRQASMMTPSTEDGFSVASMNDHSSDLAEKEMHKDIDGMVPGFSEQLASIVELAMKPIVENLKTELEAQQLNLKLGMEQVRAELKLERDSVQATVAGLREEVGRVQYEVSQLKERQDATQQVLQDSKQIHSSLKLDVVRVEAELERIRDRSESTIRKSMANVDDLRNIVGNLADMFRAQQRDLKEPFPEAEKYSTAGALDSMVVNCDEIPQILNLMALKDMSSFGDRKLRRSWAPAPLLDPEACPLSPVENEREFIDMVEPELHDYIITPPAAVVEPMVTTDCATNSSQPQQVPVWQPVRSFVKGMVNNGPLERQPKRIVA
mmetsp:Transcript_39027/g.71054  ORF Transcript_39027/g.71054 Transcript_39027/m.71054 type:complete len:448 (+) Transcript_39027:75-1418(+)